ncbi:MAG: CopD family protein [Solibacillus sp.]
MDTLVIISQALLYISFALLTGSFILSLVPASYRPAFHISAKFLKLCAVSIPVLSFFPVLSITLYIAPRFGFVEALTIVLSTYTMGHAWLATLAASMLLLFTLTIKKEKLAASLSLLFIMTAMLTIAWASHAASIDFVVGIISDFLHLLSVSVWVGILLVIGWGATNTDNWLAFSKWFSLVAISCLSITALSGVLMMDILVDSYIKSWPIAYGQGLFIKHLFLIPLVFFALANAFLVKFKLSRDPQFNPLRWIRAEGLLLLTIFTITAVFSQQSPPHGYYLTADAISPLFKLFYDGEIDMTSRIIFDANPGSVGFFFGWIFTSALTVLSIVKKIPSWVSYLLGCSVTVCVFLMVMLAVVVI